jgi:cytochrome P450
MTGPAVEGHQTAEPLAGALARPGGRSIAKWWVRRRERVSPFIWDRAFHEPISFGHTAIGRYVSVHDPAGVKRVLVDNALNYPKTNMELEFFSDLLGAGLLGSKGEVWRAHRRIMAPSFDPRSVALYGPVITQTTQAFLEQWDRGPDGAPVDMTREMNNLVLRLISRALFSADSGEMIDLIGRTMPDGFTEDITLGLLDTLPLIGKPRMRLRRREITALFRPLDAAISRLIDERAANLPTAPRDLLSRLVTTRDPETGMPMTAREVRDQVVTILVAGRETAAVTLSWIWYVLARNPAHVKRLHAELDEVLEGRAAGQEDLRHLDFTRRVVAESMRLYPAAPVLSLREARARDEICGRQIPKGMIIGIAPWVLHRHRLLWDDPDRFDPDRFLPERSAARSRFAYLPFGAGPNVCIGQSLAMNQTILVLATLAQRYAPRLTPDARIVPRARVTLRPMHGMKMLLERRVQGGRAALT